MFIWNFCNLLFHYFKKKGYLYQPTAKFPELPLAQHPHQKRTRSFQQRERLETGSAICAASEELLHKLYVQSYTWYFICGLRDDIQWILICSISVVLT